MKKVLLCSFVLLFGLSMAQEPVGNWFINTSKDAFTDAEQSILAIGENGQPFDGQSATFGILCENGEVVQITVSMTGYLDDKAMRDFSTVLIAVPL